jgi:hypothetical protein
MKKIKKRSGIIGVSGEYFVAAELSQRGVVATLTLKNTPYIDILATNLGTGKSANIQVKTMSVENNAGWHLGQKDGEPSGVANHFYVLVDLQGPGKLPQYIILPKKEFSKIIKKDYKKYISGKKKDGTPRKETNMRIFDPNRKSHLRDFSSKYVNNWEILGLW